MENEQNDFEVVGECVGLWSLDDGTEYARVRMTDGTEGVYRLRSIEEPHEPELTPAEG